MELDCSDPWEEIGSRERPKEAKNPYRYFSGPQKWDHESLETREQRLKKNLKIIERLKSIAERVEEAGGYFRLKIHGKTFDLWAASGCWFSHSKNTYGLGIDRLAELVFKYLER